MRLTRPRNAPRWSGENRFFDRLTFSEFQNTFVAFKTASRRRSMIELG